MGLREFVIRRSITAIITVIAVVIFNFFLFRLPTFLYGSDPADLILDPRMTEERQEEIRRAWGIPPKDATFGDWINYFAKTVFNTLTFKFGYSFVSFQPVSKEILARLPNTLVLIGVSTLVAVLLGIWLGVQGGKDPGKRKDSFLVTSSLFIFSMPIFWLGIILILIFAVYLRLFPIVGGTTSFPEPEGIINKIIDYAWHLTLPASTLAISSFGSWYLLVRNSVVNVFTEDYIVTARAKGLDERTVLYKHVFRNAMLPTVTVMALALANLWTGAVLTETVFNWFGMGRYFFESVVNFNWPVAEALFYIVALSVVIAYFIADILYAFLDPRVKYD